MGHVSRVGGDRDAALRVVGNWKCVSVYCLRTKLFVLNTLLGEEYLFLSTFLKDSSFFLHLSY